MNEQNYPTDTDSTLTNQSDTLELSQSQAYAQDASNNLTSNNSSLFYQTSTSSDAQDNQMQNTNNDFVQPLTQSFDYTTIQNQTQVPESASVQNTIPPQNNPLVQPQQENASQYQNTSNSQYVQSTTTQNTAQSYQDPIYSRQEQSQQNYSYMPNNTYYNDTPLLQITDLCKRYPGMGSYMSVFHMNLTIPRGRIIGLLGPNGCGKTTLIKMINGLLTPTSGMVLINGFAPGAVTKKVISYLPERTYLDNDMRVSEMIHYFCDFYEDFSPEKAYTMLQSLNINTDARLKTLSKGTKEKVQLILVMSRQADLYILDEPIAGVDPAARDYILRTIINNYNPNSTLLLSTHLISDIENVLDDVIFMKNGSLMLYTSVDSIRGQMGKSVDSYFREVYAC